MVTTKIGKKIRDGLKKSIIEDNLIIYISRDIKLALPALSEIQLQFIPNYACWFNLIEPWWKQLRLLTLKGQ